jgi:N-dimethylarginine dimethylaminohydrolase
MEYPGTEPFEGQAELKWFHGGRKAVCGYGYRSTKKTFDELDRLFQKLYGDEKPELLVIRLVSPLYYHLDIAMLEYNDNRCMIHRRAISPASLRKLKQFLGKDHVYVIDTPDTFCLNAVADGVHLITHKLTDPHIQTKLESITGLVVRQVDVSEFEKSGGSVRCMTLDVHSGA